MALDAVGLQQPLRYDVDIKSGLVRTPMTSQLMKGDRRANRVIVAIKDGKENVDLSDVTITGSFIRPPDDAEIPLVGSADGNEAIVVLEDVCYAQEGYCEISVMLTVGSTSRTILTLTGHVLSKGSGAVIDVGGVIPNINDIIAQYDEMKRVTQATQAAANAANEAASRAPYVGANGNWYVWNAASGSYIDSGSKAQGPVGPQGPAGAEIDATLKVPGKAADAKATGDALSSLSQQIGDVPARFNGLGLQTVDLNTMRDSCVFLALNCENAPTSSEWYTVAVLAGGTGSSIQIAAGSFNGSLWFRHNNGEIWGSWIKIVG